MSEDFAFEKYLQGRRPSRLSKRECTGDTRSSGTPEAKSFLDIERDFAARKEPKLSRRYMPRGLFLKKAGFAISNGAVIVDQRIVWNMSSESRYPCHLPREVGSIVGFDDKSVPGEWFVEIEQKAIGYIQQFARCRKCSNCHRHRRSLWIARCKSEASEAHRIWFVTLTMKPDTRYRFMAKCHLQGTDFWGSYEDKTPEDQWKIRNTLFYKEVSLYLKRVRKGVYKKPPPRLKFFCVIEKHKDGFPHAHLLIFEKSIDAPASEKLLRVRWWPNGFAQAKLVGKGGGADGQKAIRYATKYLSKDASFVVRGSVKLGSSCQR